MGFLFLIYKQVAYVSTTYVLPRVFLIQYKESFELLYGLLVIKTG